MIKAFNLLDEPWLPVRYCKGDTAELGLLALFEQAGEIQALAETSPPNLVALYRLLLAITHRALTRSLGQWSDEDRACWYQQGLPRNAVCDYLEQWRERFWLFHPEAPFMQVAALAEVVEIGNKRKPWTQIALGSASGNTPLVFDHAVDMAPLAISAAQAIRHLLGFLQFTPGGLVKVLRTSDKAGPVANSAVVLPQGTNLAQSLCLMLHPSAMPASGDDPSWELDVLKIEDLKGEPTLASGNNDRYTRISRSVLLCPNEPTTKVADVLFAVGAALSEVPQAPDSMVSYRVSEKNTVRLSFSAGRAIWRELPVLLPEPSGKLALPAAVLEWAMAVHDCLGDWDAEIPLLVAGLASDQAKLLRWRSETLRLPGALLHDPDKAGVLRQQVRGLEDLFGEIRRLLADMAAKTLPDPNHKDTRAKARAIVDNGPAAASFYSTAERSLPALMDYIAQGEFDKAHRYWAGTQVQAAERSWQVAARQLGSSAAVWRAEAMTSSRLQVLLKPLRQQAKIPVTKESDNE